MIIFVVYVLCLSCFLVCSSKPLVTCWERVEFLALLYVMFYCVFVHLPCGIEGSHQDISQRVIRISL